MEGNPHTHTIGTFPVICHRQCHPEGHLGGKPQQQGVGVVIIWDIEGMAVGSDAEVAGAVVDVCAFS